LCQTANAWGQLPCYARERQTTHLVIDIIITTHTLEAARVQHLLAVNAGMPAIPEPEDGMDLELLLYDTLPPDKAAESPT